MLVGDINLQILKILLKVILNDSLGGMTEEMKKQSIL